MHFAHHVIDDAHAGVAVMVPAALIIILRVHANAQNIVSVKMSHKYTCFIT